MSLAARISSVEEKLKVLVKQHVDNTFPEGAEALSAKVEDILYRANLMENQTCKVDRLGVFPGNRETAMLVPVEVQSLLHDYFLQNGWNAAKWNCMALTVPESLRDEWAKKTMIWYVGLKDFYQTFMTWSLPQEGAVMAQLPCGV